MEDGPTNYINYIRCCTETERDNEASIMLFKAAQLYPNNVRLLSLLALCLLDSGKKEEAIAITNKIFKIIDKKSINPETQEECNSLLHAGQYLLSKGDVDKAISYYKKVLQINPKTPMIHIHLADVGSKGIMVYVFIQILIGLACLFVGLALKNKNVESKA